MIDDFLSQNLLELTTSTLELFRPPERLTPSEWAAKRRYLSAESSSSPGLWKNETTPYLVGVMDAIAQGHQEVVFMKSSQVGYTESLLNLLGYLVDVDPCPVLVIQPTLEMGEAFSKDRLTPMVRDSPALSGKIAAQSRGRGATESGNTITHKNFPGGQVTITGANSPSSLASRPIRVVLADEISRYPHSAGEEGDPLSLAIKRTTTFYNRFIFKGSTPTVSGSCRIEKDWNISDQRRYFVPCPSCGVGQHLQWSQVKWTEYELDPINAVYECEHCHHLIRNRDKLNMLAGGEWRQTNPSGAIAGFHINELYSPWKTFGDVAVDFLRAKNDREMLKVWTNTSLGEAFKDFEAEEIQWETLKGRALLYPVGVVPEGAYLLTAGVDVQHTHLAVVIMAWGKGEASWVVNHLELYGNPLTPEPWDKLTDLLNAEWEAEGSSKKIKISQTAIDSSDGKMTQEVYQYCRLNAKCIPIKGASVDTAPIIRRPQKMDVRKEGAIVGSINLWSIGVTGIKDLLIGRIQPDLDSEKRIRLTAHLGDQFFEELCGERPQTTYKKGIPVRKWMKVPGVRNEALDCTVYAIAAAYSVGAHLPQFKWKPLIDRLKDPPTTSTTPMRSPNDSRGVSRSRSL